MEYPHISTNRFTLLANLNEIQQDEMDHTSKCELPHSATKTASRRSLGSKIPTIVNARISYGNSKKPLEKPSNPLRIPNHRSIKHIHKVQ